MNRIVALFIAAVVWSGLNWGSSSQSAEVDFRRDVAPILVRRCLRCHNDLEARGDVRLTHRSHVVSSPVDAPLVVPRSPSESLLMDAISGERPSMPKSGGPLSESEIETIRQWIESGAEWPDEQRLRYDPLDWWSLRPLRRQELPRAEQSDGPNSPIDAFILAKQRELGLRSSPESDRKTLIRRVTYDLIGLPPTLEEIERFVSDERPDAYEALVDRLLASPQYGERWARHWLDTVHYGDTHGYDKDKLRPNAWPYRDYVIRALNSDKPYGQFVREQLAGDYFVPNERDGVEALGFIAAGPFDFVGQIEVGDGTLEKLRVRNIDRDDMVSAAMNSFISTTVQCARCHDHKFDPISQRDYYQTQSIFAAVDRADRGYDLDTSVAQLRKQLLSLQSSTISEIQSLQETVRQRGGAALANTEQMLRDARDTTNEAKPQFGYHSQIESQPDTVKWVQIDLGEERNIASIALVGAYDDFGNIGAGFGFPLRYRVEVANDPDFGQQVQVIRDETSRDVVNPGVTPVTINVGSVHARFLRVTATRLAPRTNDYIFALAELRVLDSNGDDIALRAEVTALDSIEAPERWSVRNLVDGIYRDSRPGSASEIARLEEERSAIVRSTVDASTLDRLSELEEQADEVRNQLASFPPLHWVYAAATEFAPSGSFSPTRGKPREISVLARGNETAPLDRVNPKGLSCQPHLMWHFESPAVNAEAQGRASLANWIVDRENTLTWRSIANRLWYFHFGNGIVDSLNDFGRMGGEPSHPELLDWLAMELRHDDQSIKRLQRLIVTSSTYRQASTHDEVCNRIDAGNRFLWRMNRRRLEAEAIRDSILAVTADLRTDFGGPGFYLFGLVDDHSPRYLYDQHDPDDPSSHRRSIYRFIVRSAPDPFMTTLDCADATLLVDRRNETLTALQALALLNNRFMLAMSERLANRIAVDLHELGEGEREWQEVSLAFEKVMGRNASEKELESLVVLRKRHGLPAICRLLFNANEFVFVD